MMSDRIVTCVYCGHEYPDGTPTSQDEKLTEHIKVCKKHPMRELEQQLAAANARVAELEQENSKLASAAVEQPPYKNDLLAQNKRMQTAINRYVIGNIELLDALKAALEAKP